MANAPWIIRSRPHPQLRLFCFPYAGGGALIYHHWSQSLPIEVEVCPVLLPGREHRFFTERPYFDMDALVQTLTDELYSYLDIPFVLYGHSMGGKICYAWACHLRQQHNLVPDYFFVSAQYAPHLSPRQASIHHLPDAQFLDSLFRLGGTAAAVMQNKELMELMLPLLRADFRLYETYIPMPTEPFACPISAFYGEQDHLVSAEELAAWQLHTHNTFTLRGMPGNHFFIHSAQKQILSAISQDLRGLLSMA